MAFMIFKLVLLVYNYRGHHASVIRFLVKVVKGQSNHSGNKMSGIFDSQQSNTSAERIGEVLCNMKAIAAKD